MSVALFKRKSLSQMIRRLFVNGEQGVWYDANDFTTLFQDAAGTLPVTAVEQPVGLVLDKSQNLALGAELVTPVANQNFSSDTGYWSKDPSVSIGSGSCTFTNSPINDACYKTNLLTVGKLYQITITVSSISSGSLKINFGGGTTFIGSISSPGTYVLSGFASVNGNFGIYARSAGTNASVTSISCKQVLGNHAYQATAANRPTLTARYNYQLKTEALDNAEWTTGAVTVATSAIQVPASYGTATMFKVTANAGSASHEIYTTNVYGFVSGISYTQRWLLRKGTHRYAQIIFFSAVAGLNGYANFDLETGLVGTKGSAVTSSSMVDLGGGTYLCTVVCTAASTANGGCDVCLVSSSSATKNQSFNAAGTEYIYACCADMRPTDQATGLIPTYQRVNTSTDYDTVGFPPLIKGNGSNQFLQTASIDFTGTNKMTVWSGVRKLSDSPTFQVVSELSTDINTKAGSFAVYAPSNAQQYGFGIQSGTVSSQQSYGNAAAYVAPITNVLSAALTITAPNLASQIIAKINGAPVTLSPGLDKPSLSSAFGNYPLYLLSRAGSSLFFSGGFNSLIVLGRAASSGEIAMTENWCNYKIKAY